MKRIVAAGAAASVAVVTALGWAVLHRDGSAQPDGRRPAVPVVVALDPDDVASLRIEVGPARVDLVRRHGLWEPGPGTPPMAAELLDTRESDLFPLRAYRGVSTDASRPEFGLAAPELLAQVRDRRGRELVVSVGAATFTGEGFYARRGRDERLYLLTRRAVDTLRSVLRGEPVDRAAPRREAEALARAEQLSDPEVVTNPWLGQVLEEEGR
ncbi:MAG TPA: hypothetical protein VGL92_08665 [Acidimicrobiia bacterium]|jgi:hypothetical protein